MATLTFPLPQWIYERVEAGPASPRTHIKRRWHEADIIPSLTAGGWFDWNLEYAFDSPATKKFAQETQNIFHKWGVPDAQNA